MPLTVSGGGLQAGRSHGCKQAAASHSQVGAPAFRHPWQHQVLDGAGAQATQAMPDAWNTGTHGTVLCERGARHAYGRTKAHPSGRAAAGASSPQAPRLERAFACTSLRQSEVRGGSKAWSGPAQRHVILRRAGTQGCSQTTSRHAHAPIALLQLAKLVGQDCLSLDRAVRLHATPRHHDTALVMQSDVQRVRGATKERWCGRPHNPTNCQPPPTSGNSFSPALQQAWHAHLSRSRPRLPHRASPSQGHSRGSNAQDLWAYALQHGSALVMFGRQVRSRAQALPQVCHGALIPHSCTAWMWIQSMSANVLRRWVVRKAGEGGCVLADHVGNSGSNGSHTLGTFGTQPRSQEP